MVKVGSVGYPEPVWTRSGGSNHEPSDRTSSGGTEGATGGPATQEMTPWRTSSSATWPVGMMLCLLIIAETLAGLQVLGEMGGTALRIRGKGCMHDQ